MKIIIPMTGQSKRFKNKGYTIPKQFLEVENKTIIEHVVDMYPGEEDINFIINKDHLENKKLKSYFKSLSKFNLVSIDYQRSGPGGAILESDLLETDDEVVINYCDFANIWDWQDFKNYIKTFKPDGIIPVYKGLHPHSIYGNDYAFLKVQNNKVIDIKEKESFTSDKMNEPTSTGAYYFQNGFLAKKYIQRSFELKKFTSNEIYISTAYQDMIKDKLNVMPYYVEYFFQWGTPEDFEEFIYSLKEVKNIQNKDKINLDKLNLVIPAAGESKRFKEKNYKISKIYLDLNGDSIINTILNCFKNDIYRKILIRSKNLDDSTRKENKNLYHEIQGTTNGQAESTLKLIEKIDNSRPVLIHSADCILDKKTNMNIEDSDIVIFTKKNYRRSIGKENQYGWVTSREGTVFEINIKEKPYSTDANIIMGIFLFKDVDTYIDLYNKTTNRLPNYNDLHIDFLIETALEEGMKVKEVFSEESLIIGTPLEYEIYKYMLKAYQYLVKK